MTTWAERWATSDGYQKAMAVHAKRQGEFWERHHRVMAELDERDRITDMILDGIWSALKWGAAGVLGLVIVAAVF